MTSKAWAQKTGGLLLLLAWIALQESQLLCCEDIQTALKRGLCGKKWASFLQQTPTANLEADAQLRPGLQKLAALADI